MARIDVPPQTITWTEGDTVCEIVMHAHCVDTEWAWWAPYPPWEVCPVRRRNRLQLDERMANAGNTVADD